MSLDLTTLTPPAVIEPLDFERILAEIKSDLLERYPEAADTLALESEPLTKLIETFAYRELLYRARVNDAARAHLLAFAIGGDLDHLAALFGVVRMDGEDDDRLRLRLQLRIAALAGNGTAQHYEYHALSASGNVRAARATQLMPGSVHVVLWLIDATQNTAELVRDVLCDEARLMLGVIVSVGVARPRTIAVRARVWRAPTALPGLLDLLPTRLADALAQRPLGGVVARSWVVAALHAAGVAAVEFMADDAPPAATVLADDEYPMLGAVELIDGGVMG